MGWNRVVSQRVPGRAHTSDKYVCDVSLAVICTRQGMRADGIPACPHRHIQLKMKGLYTILLLLASNVFMTFAWYGHLKLQEMKISDGWPLIAVILFSWGLAFFEYCAQVPANRIGFTGNGGPFNLIQLKVIQEVISLTVFTLVVMVCFKGQALQWNHFVAFGLLILAVFFVFLT